jgi:hypothetical protein
MKRNGLVDHNALVTGKKNAEFYRRTMPGAADMHNPSYQAEGTPLLPVLHDSTALQSVEVLS